jgi:hypothetical protein
MSIAGGIGGEPVSNSVPGFIIDQRRMLAGEELTFVCNPTGVNRVREQPVEVPAREGCAAALDAIRCPDALRPQFEPVGLVFDPATQPIRRVS